MIKYLRHHSTIPGPNKTGIIWYIRKESSAEKKTCCPWIYYIWNYYFKIGMGIRKKMQRKLWILPIFRQEILLLTILACTLEGNWLEFLFLFLLFLIANPIFVISLSNQYEHYFFYFFFFSSSQSSCQQHYTNT